MKQIRKETLGNFISERGVVRLADLHTLFPEVSLMTIHRDLDELAAEGRVVKMRGGARAISHISDPLFDSRVHENSAAKNLIAQKALSLLHPGSSVFFDAGTSVLALARAMQDMHINVFTTAPNIALELMRLPSPSINICSGSLNRSNLALSGHSTLEMLEKINIDMAFIGVSGCSLMSGFTCGLESEMMVKRLVIQKARTNVLLMDTAKLMRLMPFTFGRLEDIDYLVSDGQLPDDFIAAARDAGVTVL